ncbi:alpha-terpineol synthase, chloroplastic-like [Magnolia sinica]|uniref:alpha-terpineol synthase, chloroplastic-like n=1 Tax=Magnolia sinica TaxID=86752 RepID=UPI00265A868C|nr:alpha-terpineol synthase, chloroplastic-like [Magnolia sinica]
MALYFSLPSVYFSLPCLLHRPLVAFRVMNGPHFPKHLQCLASDQVHVLTDQRRSANYTPSIWDYDFIQSLSSGYEGAMHARQELEEAVRCLLQETSEPLDQLELIDAVQRLGLGYLFEVEIKGALKALSSISNKDLRIEEDLYSTALRFRLLRQHGYQVSEDVFDSFMDGMGTFKACLSQETKGMLSLYEASHLSIEGETILDEAKSFTSRHLQGLKGKVGLHLERRLDHALKLPLHWRMPRSEARWAIDTYKGEVGMNPILLELAKLDFNRVQAKHQRNLRKMSRWWRDLGLGETLSFSRDRLMECFYWAQGVAFEPQFGHCREVLTKAAQLITTIDDVYDVYGSLDELELFTEAVDKWDAKAVDQLPYYMKMCFLALYNTTNQIAYEALKDQDLDIIPYLSKVWADFCKAMLVEATWCNQRYQPTLAEYLNNGWISSSGAVLLVHGFLNANQTIKKEALECLENDPNIIRWPAMILRLCNDLATSKVELERGDVPTSIQCYMNDANVSERVAHEHIKGLIADIWKKMNEECGPQSPFPEPFVNMAFDLARMAHCIYLYGDGHSNPDGDTKERIMSLLVEPIPLNARLAHTSKSIC